MVKAPNHRFSLAWSQWNEKKLRYGCFKYTRCHFFSFIFVWRSTLTRRERHEKAWNLFLPNCCLVSSELSWVTAIQQRVRVIKSKWKIGTSRYWQKVTRGIIRMSRHHSIMIVNVGQVSHYCFAHTYCRVARRYLPGRPRSSSPCSTWAAAFSRLLSDLLRVRKFLSRLRCSW